MVAADGGTVMNDELVGAAYHEAGHAVAALVLSLPLDTVTIEGLSKFWNPIARYEPDNLGPNDRSIIEKAIVMWLAGYYAEKLARPQNDAKFGAQGCIEVASDFAELLAIQPGANAKAKDIFEPGLEARTSPGGGRHGDDRRRCGVAHRRADRYGRARGGSLGC